MSNELLEEVREDVRREELIAFWQKYWQMIVGGLCVAAVLTIGYVVWQHQQEKYRNEQTNHYEKALIHLTNKQTDQAIAELNMLSKKGDSSYLTLSLFKQAGVIVDNNILQQIIDDKKIDESFRHLASLIFIERLMNANDYAAALKKLTTLVNVNSPWRASAQELLAITLYKTGSAQQAFDAFQALADDKAAPQDIRLRAAAFVEFIREN